METITFLLLIGMLTPIMKPHADRDRVQIAIEGMKFVPDSIRVKKGDAVEFTNLSAYMHNVVSPANKIRSPFLKKGDTFRYNADKVGIIEYYCEPHKAMGMKGKIIVE